MIDANASSVWSLMSLLETLAFGYLPRQLRPDPRWLDRSMVLWAEWLGSRIDFYRNVVRDTGRCMGSRVAA